MSDPMYLTDEWFAEAAASVATTPFVSSSDHPIAFSYEICDVPEWHPKAGQAVTYRIEIDPGAGTASMLQTDDPGDVRFAMAFDIAYDVARGAVSGSRAFLDGSIRLGGDVAALIEQADDLKQLSGYIGVADA